MIEAKASGKQKLVASSPADMSDRVINLMDALEKSLHHARQRCGMATPSMPPRSS